MSFKEFISFQIKKSSLTRNECIAKLNLYHFEFNKLDTVTLSRWINGKTVPSLYKQILISEYFNVDVFSFIKNKNYTLTNDGKKLEELHRRLTSKVSNSFSNISYNYSRYDKKTYLVNNYDKEKYRNKFLVFYTNFYLYQKIFSIVDENNIKSVCITFEEYRSNCIVGHDSMSLVSTKYFDIFNDFFETKLDFKDDFWLANIGYHSSSQSFNIAFTSMLYFLYKNKQQSYLSLVRSDDTFHNLTEVGYEQIGKTITDCNEKIYLTKSDVKKVLSHPFVISQINNILNKYEIDSFFSQEIKDEYFKR
ncbi:hypothetical protein [Photobacterium damselae]|uniref:hypothetical protein n=1 Tax=Photobacterium damselae TaxID=38293 RepID=UPI001F44A160|nr:hypothetical protein [Photobacterium damselae]UKA11866.1 hypothetical protein IHC91_18990 [Photobacterium damselae subsp. damselae]